MIKLYLSLFFALLLINSSHSQVVREEISISTSQSKVSISKKGKTFQLTDEEGKVVISDIDTLYQQKRTDFIFVQKKGLWGVVSSYGNILIPINFNKTERIYNEFWTVTKNQKKGIYSIAKGEILPVEFDNIEFSQSYNEEFIVTKNDKKGVFNYLGKEIIPINYDQIKKKKGVLILSKNNKTDYFLNNKIISDSLVLDKSFEIYGDYISDTKTFYVFYKDKKFGIIDNKNNVIIQPKYDDIEYRRVIENSKNENFLVVKKDLFCGMIDFNEKEIIPFKYQNIEVIHPNYAVLTINNLKHFYNFRTKKINTNFDFEKFDMYSGQFTRLKKGNKETLVSNNDFSNLLFPFMYEDISENNNLFVVKLNSKYGLVDKNNKVLIPILYEHLYISCNKVIAQINNKYGILSLENKILMPFEYPNIVGYSEKTEVIQKDFKTKTYDCNLICIENCN